MNRYHQWFFWRLRQALAPPLSRQCAWACVFLALCGLSAVVLGLSSPAVIRAWTEWWSPTTPAQQVEKASVGRPSFSSPGHAPFPPPLSDPLASPASLEEVRRALSDISSRPDWLASLEQKPLVRAGTRVHVSHPHALSDRQRRLFQVQGMRIVPWSTPGERDVLTGSPEFWVRRTALPGWAIHVRPMDVSPPSSQDPGELVVLRAILWIDALDALEKWQLEHPAPTPPNDLAPGGVDVLLLPSSATHQMLSLAATWMGTLLIMAAVALSQFSSWERRRSGGLWVFMAGLSHRTYPWLLTQAALLALPLFLSACVAALMAWMGFTALGFTVEASWIWRLPVIVALGAFLAHAVSGLSGVLPRLWSRLLSAIWILLLSGGTLWLAEAWPSLRPLAAVFLSPDGLALSFLAAALALICLRVSAWCLDRRARSGYQVVW